MRPDLLAHLDAHWAARLHCQPSLIRSQLTSIISDPAHTGAEVWLFDKSCVMIAAPPVAHALQVSVGKRTPAQAFEPSRLRDAVSMFDLELHGPDAILALCQPSVSANGINWIRASEVESEIAAAVRVAVATGIPMVDIPLKCRPPRRAAEACGFELYASVVFIGDRPKQL